MRLQLIFLLLILSLEAFLLGLYLKDLLRLVVLLKSFLMILMMVQLIQLDLFALCLAQRRKKSACWEATNLFLLLFLVVLMIVTTVATPLYFYFSSFVPSLASDCKKDQKLVHAVQKQIMSA